jgi:hypothetical protein
MSALSWPQWNALCAISSRDMLAGMPRPRGVHLATVGKLVDLGLVARVKLPRALHYYRTHAGQVAIEATDAQLTARRDRRQVQLPLAVSP